MAVPAAKVGSRDIVFLQDTGKVLNGGPQTSEGTEESQEMGTCWHPPHLEPDQGTIRGSMEKYQGQAGELCVAHDRGRASPFGTVNVREKDGDEGPRWFISHHIR
jgi:hypothetical protein